MGLGPGLGGDLLGAGHLRQLADRALLRLIPELPVRLRRRHVGDCADLVEGDLAAHKRATRCGMSHAFSARCV